MSGCLTASRLTDKRQGCSCKRFHATPTWCGRAQKTSWANKVWLRSIMAKICEHLFLHSTHSLLWPAANPLVHCCIIWRKRNSEKKRKEIRRNFHRSCRKNHLKFLLARTRCKTCRRRSCRKRRHNSSSNPSQQPKSYLMLEPSLRNSHCKAASLTVVKILMMPKMKEEEYDREGVEVTVIPT